MKFNKNIKTNIANVLIKEWVRIYNDNENDKALEILLRIWDLNNMPSEDRRYKNAYEDIFQHMFRNQDWDSEYLFTSRLQIMQELTDFKKFIEVMIDPKYYSNLDYFTGVCGLIDYELNKNKLKLVIDEYSDLGFPIQKIYPLGEFNELPYGVKKNNIPFYVYNEHYSKPIVSEYFKLTPILDWNDYSVVSKFNLTYYKNEIPIFIGETKIIHNEELVTWRLLPNEFLQLGIEFCSLSSFEDFYDNLLKNFKLPEIVSILFALQDSAYFLDIHDRFAKTYNFRSSLIRLDTAERMLRQLRPKLHTADLENLYSFDYRLKLPFVENPIRVTFDFNNVGEVPSRIFAIIGKNGTGKTQLLSMLPQSLERNDPADFYHKMPVFSKIISISYSVFDTYSIPKKNVNFNYVYCGLKDDEGDMRSSRSLVLSFHNNWKKIDELGRTIKWKSILENFIEAELVDTFIIKSETNQEEYKVSLDGFNVIKNKLSSGQSILLYIITQVVANIRFDSLILYDEPETHLHPNAIVDLMNTIYELVNDFESYCLIATHSPLVIREVFSKNVYVMNKIDNITSINRIRIESFGENLGILSDEVFGDRNVSKQYKSIIEKLVIRGLTFNQIVDLIEFDDVPLSLNTRIFIENYIKRYREEF